MTQNIQTDAKNSYKQPESVLIIICTDKADVLLMERVTPVAFWQSVTGSLEAGESPQQTAERELFEETGLAVPAGVTCLTTSLHVEDAGIQNIYPIHPGWRHRYPESVAYNKENVFLVRLTSRCEIQLNANEHKQYHWYPKSLAIKHCSSITNRRAIELLV